MIIKPKPVKHKHVPVAPKQPEPQPKVEKKLEEKPKEEIKKISSQQKVKRILEELAIEPIIESPKEEE